MSAAAACDGWEQALDALEARVTAQEVALTEGGDHGFDAVTLPASYPAGADRVRALVLLARIEELTTRLQGRSGPRRPRRAPSPYS